MKRKLRTLAALSCALLAALGLTVPTAARAQNTGTTATSQQKAAAKRGGADALWTAGAPLTSDTWHGYTVDQTRIDSFTVWMAQPRKPRKKRPWVLSIQDFGDTCHWQMCEKLLAAGAHVVAINSYNTYGCDYGLQLMDSVYTLARRRFGLSRRCGLFGISRAGL